jgi:D-beta-D-heptose 7-phosphate kinase/D-beta-D-heptose 1-phosphate adenosyltransferase
MKVWVNGSFDVLHYGHLKLLEYASSLGYLVVGIDSDDRIKKLKGKNRPVNSEERRKFFLDSLSFVNEVVVFNSDYELSELIKKVGPEYLVVGDDYQDKKIIGSEFANNIILFKKIPELSTSKILSYDK